MSPEEAVALNFLCVVVGLIGLPVYVECESRRVRQAAAAWMVVWCGPPLFRLYVATLLS